VDGGVLALQSIFDRLASWAQPFNETAPKLPAGNAGGSAWSCRGTLGHRKRARGCEAWPQPLEYSL